MDWMKIEGNWNQLKGRLRKQFGKLSDDDMEQIAGKRDKMIGKLQERYGYTHAEAERRLDEVASAVE